MATEMAHHDLVAISVAIWYWLWVWLQYGSLDTDTKLRELVVEGLGYICYHAMGFLLTWFTAASITAEADALYKCAQQILEKLNEQEFALCFDADADAKDKLVDYHHIMHIQRREERDIQWRELIAMYAALL